MQDRYEEIIFFRKAGSQGGRQENDENEEEKKRRKEGGREVGAEGRAEGVRVEKLSEKRKRANRGCWAKEVGGIRRGRKARMIK